MEMLSGHSNYEMETGCKESERESVCMCVDASANALSPRILIHRINGRGSNQIEQKN